MSKSNQAELEVLLSTLTLKTPDESMRSTPSNNWVSVIDSIYAHQHTNFISRLSSPSETVKPSLQKTQKLKVFTYPDPHKKLFSKEDGFFNPSALYLSRKPLVFNRNYRKETQTGSKIVNLTPSLKTEKKKKKKFLVNRKSLTVHQDYDPLKMLKKRESCLESPKVLSKTKSKTVAFEKNLDKSNDTKGLREEVLRKIDKDCKDMKSFRNVSPKVEKAKKLVDDYRKNIQWTASVLKNYETQESEVLRQLFLLSDFTRNEMNKDIAATAEQIRRGTMDPALKHRNKRKIIQFS
jgi:hypothetical protein